MTKNACYSMFMSKLYFYDARVVNLGMRSRTRATHEESPTVTNMLVFEARICSKKMRPLDAAMMVSNNLNFELKRPHMNVNNFVHGGVPKIEFNSINQFVRTSISAGNEYSADEREMLDLVNMINSHGGFVVNFKKNTIRKMNKKERKFTNIQKQLVAS